MVTGPKALGTCLCEKENKISIRIAIASQACLFAAFRIHNCRFPDPYTECNKKKPYTIRKLCF